MDPLIVAPIAGAVGAVAGAVGWYYKSKPSKNGKPKVCEHHEATCQKIEALDENVRDVQVKTDTIMRSTAKIEGILEMMNQRK